jgi:hypothetical protein
MTMKRITQILLTLALFTSTSVLANDLERLAGKWSVNKTSDEGQKFTQVIEIKKDKLTFKILGEDKAVRLYAEGTIKLEKLGPFSVMKVTDIKGGQSENDLSPVDDDRTLIYQLGYDTWTVASNFDKERDQRPSVDVYKKADK